MVEISQSHLHNKAPVKSLLTKAQVSLRGGNACTYCHTRTLGGWPTVFRVWNPMHLFLGLGLGNPSNSPLVSEVRVACVKSSNFAAGLYGSLGPTWQSVPWNPMVWLMPASAFLQQDPENLEGRSCAFILIFLFIWTFLYSNLNNVNDRWALGQKGKGPIFIFTLSMIGS